MENDDDTKPYLIVAGELSIGRRDEGLWTKAFALENGDEKATKARYIRERVEQLKHQNSVFSHQKSPEPIVATDTTLVQPEQDFSEEHETSADPSPWSRLFARGIDLALVIVLVLGAKLAMAIHPSIREIGAIASAWLSAVIFGVALLGYETVALSLFGTTPGKAILGLRIMASDGSDLNAGRAFRRPFWVWASGNGCYLLFPIMTIFLWWRGYKQLTTDGNTSWDDRAGSSVTQSHIGPLRFSIAAFIATSLVISIVVLNTMSVQAKKMERNAERQATNSTSSGIMSGKDYTLLRDAPPAKPSSARNLFDAFTPNNEDRYYSGIWYCLISKGSQAGSTQRYLQYLDDGRMFVTPDDPTFKAPSREGFRVDQNGRYTETIDNKWYEASIKALSGTVFEKTFLFGASERCDRISD